MNSRRFPRTLNEAFPYGAEYGCAIERSKPNPISDWALAVVISLALSGVIGAVLFAAVHFGSALIADHSAERAQADSLQDAIQAEAAQARFAKAAQAICGPNAAWADVGAGVVQCTTKRGFKTQIARVQP